MTIDIDDLDALVEFDTPFVVDGERDVRWAEGVHAPEVVHVGHVPGVELEVHGPWTPLSGHSSQHGYGGSIMHQSETLSGGLAERVLSTPGTYVLCEPVDADDPEAIVGWVALRLDDPDLDRKSEV